MTGFFFDIRSQLQNRYSGRYLSLLLREVGRHEPRALAAIVAQAGKEAIWRDLARKIRRREVSIECEYPFDGTTGRRRADIALVEDEGPVLLVEVKEDDIGNPGNAAQLDDYLAQARAGIPFLHLSRFALEPEDRDRLAEAGADGVVASLRYREIPAALPDGPITAMIKTYLEDIDVGMYQPIGPDEDRSVAFSLAQMLGFPHAHGLGRLHAERSVGAFPKLLKRMFDNVEYVAESIHQENRALIGQRFTRKLQVVPEYDLRKLAEAIEKNADRGRPTARPLPGQPGVHVRSGTVYFYGIGRLRTPKGVKPALGKNDWLYVEIGFSLSTRRGAPGSRKLNRRGARKPLVRYGLYASFYGNTLKSSDTYQGTSSLGRFPSEDIVLRALSRYLRKSLNDAREVRNEKIRAVLKGFKIPTF